MPTRNDLARKRLTPAPLIAELKEGRDAATHLLHEIVIAAFRREHGRDPASTAEYRSIAPITASYTKRLVRLWLRAAKPPSGWGPTTIKPSRRRFTSSGR